MRGWDVRRVIGVLLLAYATAQVVLLFVVFLEHAVAPEISRGCLLEGMWRVMHGLPLYPLPGSDYVAHAYNPLLVALAAGVGQVTGWSQQTLRLTVIAGSLGSWFIVVAEVLRRTGSKAQALLAAGLFGAAFLAWDGYLVYANPDSWMLFSSVVGVSILDRGRSPARNMAAIVVLVVAFWFKQHGAIFLGGESDHDN